MGGKGLRNAGAGQVCVGPGYGAVAVKGGPVALLLEISVLVCG